MFYTDKNYLSEYEVKKSLFISVLSPYDYFDDTLKELQSTHKKANHIVWAYRFLNDKGQITENCTDDGEPKNTAGKPTLNVVRGRNLINSVIFTVRYFGGIKLGTGGLVKAYSESANRVVESADLIEYVVKEIKEITFNYSEIKRMDYLLSKNELEIVEKQFGNNNVKYIISGDKTDLNRFLNILKD